MRLRLLLANSSRGTTVITDPDLLRSVPYYVGSATSRSVASYVRTIGATVLMLFCRYCTIILTVGRYTRSASQILQYPSSAPSPHRVFVPRISHQGSAIRDDADDRPDVRDASDPHARTRDPSQNKAHGRLHSPTLAYDQELSTPHGLVHPGSRGKFGELSFLTSSCCPETAYCTVGLTPEGSEATHS